jgi:hypothetical protein
LFALHQEKNMATPRDRNPYGIQQATSDHQPGGGAHDPLQEMVPVVDDDEISEADREDVGDLGNDKDKLAIDDLLLEIEIRPATRLSFLLHKAAECIRALKELRTTPADPWPQDRIPTEHWRDLADQALGLVAGAARREVDSQRSLRSMSESDRQSMQVIRDSQLGIDIFRRGFKAESDAWERAYWCRAVEEAFGKKAWTGPNGWRSKQ